MENIYEKYGVAAVSEEDFAEISDDLRAFLLAESELYAKEQNDAFLRIRARAQQLAVILASGCAIALFAKEYFLTACWFAALVFLLIRVRSVGRFFTASNPSYFLCSSEWAPELLAAIRIAARTNSGLLSNELSKRTAKVFNFSLYLSAAAIFAAFVFRFL